MSGPDVLFEVRNNFYLGAYQAAINEAADLEVYDQEQVERDTLVYRSYIALGSNELVLNEIADDAPTALQAVRLFAKYSRNKSVKSEMRGMDAHMGFCLNTDSEANKAMEEEVLATQAEWLADPSCSSNPMVLLMAGTIYAHEENYVEALKCCHVGTNFELMALCAHVYLMMDRPDQAEKQVKTMSSLDDDHTLTQLATAWTNLALGGAKVQEAFYIFQELGDKFTWTTRLHNGLATCNMRKGDWEDAEKELLEAFSKDSNDPSTLANLITTSLHLGKPNSRYMSQLKLVAPGSGAVKRMDAADEAFTRAAAAFA